VVTGIPADPGKLFLDNLPVIEGVVRGVCRSHRMVEADAEEFAAEVRLRLVEDDYAVLRQFQQRSNLRTYLTIVVQRLYFDYRNRQWGKWRPSVAAERMGPIAIRLETLLVRDRMAFDEACEHIISNERQPATRRDLEEIAFRLPRRTRRVQVGADELTLMPAAEEIDEVPASERERTVRKVTAALSAAVRALAPRDRLILRMRFQDGLTIAGIALALHCEARPLYREMPRLLDHLRSALEAAGVDAATAKEIVSRQDLDVGLALSSETEKRTGL